jgi:glutathione S-transferase
VIIASTRLIYCRLVDEEISIVQSQVILRYIAKKYGFHGNTKAEQLRIEYILEGLAALRQSYFQLVFTDNMVCC